VTGSPTPPIQAVAFDWDGTLVDRFGEPLPLAGVIDAG
jgi:hypothetical protein